MKKLIIICILLVLVGSAFAERKALVIANSRYDGMVLTNAIADADSMQAVLQKLEFSVERYNNMKLGIMTAAIDSFAVRITANDEVVFYFSGHGTNANNVNYIVPYGANLSSKQEFSKTAYSVSSLAQRLKKAKSSIIVLEASKAWGVSGTKAVPKPFVEMAAAASNQVIVTSAQPEKIVQNSSLSYSKFTQCLTEQIGTSEEGFNTLFPLIVSAVQSQTAKLQKPWISGALKRDFHFVTHEMYIRWHRTFNKEDIDGGGSLSW
ncbi:MAG: caspase family protein [Candidatus Cloacimonetes bacterium]|nr:caspase family protein [Candidatus Cloacimonadota bacterium]